MPPLQKDLAGQSVINDWFEQGDNQATIQQLVDVILPVEEMAQFQRRIRTLPKTPIATVIGDFPIMSGVVPPGETWRMLWSGVLFTDAVTGMHTILLRIIPATPGDVAFVIVTRDVNSGVPTPLYPSSPVRAASVSDSKVGAYTGPPIELFPGDEIQILDTTAVGAAVGTFTPTFRYEVLPPPVRLEKDSIVTVARN